MNLVSEKAGVDPELLEPPLRQNYFIFKENFQKNQEK